MLIKLGFWTPVLFFLTLKSGFPETSSQLTPSSSGESVSAVNSGAVGEKPGAFAPVCTANGTREGDELAEHPLIWPFLSEGH